MPCAFRRINNEIRLLALQVAGELQVWQQDAAKDYKSGAKQGGADGWAVERWQSTRSKYFRVTGMRWYILNVATRYQSSVDCSKLAARRLARQAARALACVGTAARRRRCKPAALQPA